MEESAESEDLSKARIESMEYVDSLDNDSNQNIVKPNKKGVILYIVLTILSIVSLCLTIFFLQRLFVRSAECDSLPGGNAGSPAWSCGFGVIMFWFMTMVCSCIGGDISIALLSVSIFKISRRKDKKAIIFLTISPLLLLAFIAILVRLFLLLKVG